MLLAPLLIGTAAPSRPNPLLILIEDHGAHLGFAGIPRFRTPHIDELAQGLDFDRTLGF